MKRPIKISIPLQHHQFAVVLSTLLYVVCGVYAATADTKLDRIKLNDGRSMDAEVVDADLARLRYTQVSQFGVTSTVLPLTSVKSVAFAWEEEAAQAVGSSETKTLREVWQRRGKFLAVPGSPSGDVGIALAESLLATNQPEAATEAEAVASRILKEDWSAARRARARELLLEIRIARGEAKEVAAETEPKLNSSARDERLSATYILALALNRQLDDLLVENPRWQQDAEIKARIEALTHRIFDLLLAPMLAESAPPDVAARSHWTMVQLLRRQGDLATAASAAQDIVEIFPETRYALMARQFLESHQPTKHPATPNDPS